MIRINFSIANPFKHKPFSNIWACAWRVSENKTLEVQIYRYAYNLVELTVSTFWQGEDHAGPMFELGILGWHFTVSLPDNRHWNYENNQWEKYNTD